MGIVQELGQWLLMDHADEGNGNGRNKLLTSKIVNLCLSNDRIIEFIIV
jgi:hypothetical protein